jgi:hypothetical protein
MRKLAEEVAAGCDGAGRRFISVVATLMRAGLTGNDAVAQGKEFALHSDQAAQAFVGVFRIAYSEEGLDLDLGASLGLARDLSVEFDGEALWAYGDFKRVAELCMGKRGFDLPRGECGRLAQRIAKNSIKGTSGAEFARAYQFLRVKKKGPGMTTAQAVDFAEKLTLAGPDAIDNFISGFQFAMNRKGLNASVEEALIFAEKMALMTPGANTKKN